MDGRCRRGSPANKFYGGRIGYAAGPFDAAAAYGYTYADAAGNITAPNWNLGGSWNFGVLKAVAFYGQLRIDGLAGGDAKQDNWFVGAVAPIGQWNLKSSYGQVKQSGNRLDVNKANQFALVRTTTCPSARRCMPPPRGSTTRTRPTACRHRDRR